MLNTLPIESQLRAPRGIVKINGKQCLFLDLEVDNNNYYQADTFRVVLPLSGQPKEINLDYFASQPAILVEIFIGFPTNPNQFTENELKKFIIGQVDTVDVNMGLQAMTVILAGRDLTAKFIDNKTTEKFPNLTSSQIATMLAKRRGLTPVITETKTRVGLYYQDEQVHLTNQSSEWDLLTFLAQQEGFQVYVSGMELHFEPMPLPSDNPYVLKYQQPSIAQNHAGFNGTILTLERNLTLARDVIVKVRSFNQKTKKSYTKIAKATHNKSTVLSGAAQPIGDAQVYVRRYPGLTPEQALKRAQQILRDVTRQEMKLRTVIPGDNLLSVRNIIQLVGTNTRYDQIYYPNSIIRRLSIDSGYEMEIDAKNHAPDSEVLI